MLKGKHLIAGEWVGGETTFTSQPSSGEPHTFADGSPELVDRAARAAEEAFWSYSALSRAERAAFLRSIAEEIDKRGDEITKIGSEETGLPAARLTGERGRTTGQLKLFADHIEKGEYLDRRHDVALPDRQPLPRPEIKLVQQPIGPVAVFGASNFPLAFSTAGGDTASALAAGCPVVVKGHSAHPGTGDLVAQAIDAAIRKHKLHPGVFSLVQGVNHAVGGALVQHPLIKAVGFTGSLRGGRALFDLCAARPEPIPFFGELGSVNPMFVMPEAVKARGEAIAKGWAGSLTMGAGQFCTNPGIAVILDGPEASAFTETTVESLRAVAPQTMLTDGIAKAYRDGAQRIENSADVGELIGTACNDRAAAPYLFETTGDVFLANEALSEEVFGPLGIVVKVGSLEDMAKIAHAMHGQLTATLHIDKGDYAEAAKLMPVLQRKVGRVLANGFPTGVEVSEAMVHGGPYPASTNFGATSVGTMAIRRFLRPVSYQNIPAELLPADIAAA
ncbi:MULTISPECIES: aldehyde dehydrogenase (NADP(+)) [Mesorhizobium]|uniref:Aldehyde dehydrogenase (NADP(+)) n=1 Tax=Mesorhizobium denitrificans TaxID=2294114 RepID=A0A371XJE1_9HYPH|nr:MULTISPECIES: aldehyde dehydrogenase (NADP(+)) [Mesorhizobium]RFC69348.1 aldehyde dehydrogenase (NADP(+)) [Mesorhizobium denitrificans]